MTFAGMPLPPCSAISRPRRPHPVVRPQHLRSPNAWLVLWQELLGADPRLAWASWQAAGTSTYSEVRALAQPVLLWPQCPPGLWGLAGKGLTPARLIKAIELLLLEGKLTSIEAARLEECILRKTDAHGNWQIPSYTKETDDAPTYCADTHAESL
jgi:hypothetical protein